MNDKPDVLAIRLIGEEVVRLLSLSDEELDNQAREGLNLIAELARWREVLAAPVPKVQRNR
ncbi:hypothetical protein M1B34_28125 [Pseudomonas sp. MAFF 302030]|uniref:Uncharacterized protein n=1 Tax=Pseudomonas morbosilactucae TaxID=2938197 RepID=A0A9X1Z0C4_9PSED|nr:hypothetical protein [Pseudomonas morbosilactucae]MCK9801432.1 hypothetical protein [Pseudomonas morbosilactucae]